MNWRDESPYKEIDEFIKRYKDHFVYIIESEYERVFDEEQIHKHRKTPRIVLLCVFAALWLSLLLLCIFANIGERLLYVIGFALWLLYPISEIYLFKALNLSIKGGYAGTAKEILKRSVDVILDDVEQYNSEKYAAYRDLLKRELTTICFDEIYKSVNLKTAR